MTSPGEEHINLPKIFGKGPHKRKMHEYCVYTIIYSAGMKEDRGSK